MAKKKQGFFERLTNKNAAQENQNQLQKNKKRKSGKIMIFSAVLASAIVTGITIPLVVNSTKSKYIKALPSETVVFSFTDPNDKTKKIEYTIKDLKLQDLQKDRKNLKKQLEQVNRLAKFYLYEKEAKASREYQRLWNASLKPGEKTNETIRLKSIDELKDSYRNNLLDIKKNIQKQFGFSNWETQFNSQLINNYDGAKTIEEAVDYQVFKDIQNAALRRFRLEKNFNKESIGRTANSDIYELNENGEPDTSKIKYHKGDLVFPFYVKDKNYFEFNDNFMPFMSESFIMNDKYKSADKFLEHYYKNDNAYIISQFTFPGIVPNKKTNANEQWNVAKDTMKKLMFYWPIDSNDIEAKSSTTMIKDNFKPFDEYVELAINNNSNQLPPKAVTYSTILTKLSSDDADVKNNWGTKGLTSLLKLLSDTSSIEEGIAIMSDVLHNTNALPEIDLFKTLDDIRTSLGVAAPDFNGLTTKEEKQAEVSKFNEKIKKMFDDANEENKTGLYSEEFKNKIIKPLSQLFETADGKVHSVYKLKDNNDIKVILTTKGIQLLYIKSVDEYNSGDYKKTLMNMLKNDFQLEKKFKNLSGVRYNALKVLDGSLTNNNLVNDIMLHDSDFVEYLLKQTNIYALDKNGEMIKDETKNKYTQEIIDSLIAYNKSIILGDKEQQQLNIVTSLDSWMKNKANSNINADFEIKDDIVYFADNKQPVSGVDTPANKIMMQKLKELIKIFK
ncbi:HinT-interacting membrane complex protein P80 [Mycoplasmopsis lipofaciens]|uniref:HinT-interacting membrane complex protein P80 n=1 Tax=Mycoplasmopsis lipofaciens TaxID=114884 RepID=UPI00048039CE|nr:hypothetical protein [Mycoplasmopsis lipofaciens]